MFTSVFGISIKYETWNHQDSLPVYIAGSYDFHTAYIGNRQLRGVRPFLSNKYDITKHKRYKELADFNKNNAFDVEKSIYMLYFFMFFQERNLKVGRKEKKVKIKIRSPCK